jgi:hypothetical protein
MRIVEELISFYRHIYLNLPGFTRLWASLVPGPLYASEFFLQISIN